MPVGSRGEETGRTGPARIDRLAGPRLAPDLHQGNVGCGGTAVPSTANHYVKYVGTHCVY